jgi:carbon storage regulator
MLVLSRKAGEGILVDGDITISVLSIEAGRVRIGIRAPLDVPIVREELLSPPPPIFPTLYTLIARNPQGDILTHSISARDLEGTRRMAHELMGLIAQATSVDVYDYQPQRNLADAEPIETVPRRGEAHAGTH